MPRLMFLVILTMLASGCEIATSTPTDALCDGTRQARADHAKALVEDGGDRSVVTGEVLIRKIDAWCRQ